MKALEKAEQVEGQTIRTIWEWLFGSSGGLGSNG